RAVGLRPDPVHDDPRDRDPLRLDPADAVLRLAERQLLGQRDPRERGALRVGERRADPRRLALDLLDREVGEVAAPDASEALREEAVLLVHVVQDLAEAAE